MSCSTAAALGAGGEQHLVCWAIVRSVCAVGCERCKRSPIRPSALSPGASTAATVASQRASFSSDPAVLAPRPSPRPR